MDPESAHLFLAVNYVVCHTHLHPSDTFANARVDLSDEALSMFGIAREAADSAKANGFSPIIPDHAGKARVPSEFDQLHADLVDKHLPHFKKSNGRDHIFIFPKGFVVDGKHVFHRGKDTFATPSCLPRSFYARLRRGVFPPWKDIVIPGMARCRPLYSLVAAAPLYTITPLHRRFRPLASAVNGEAYRENEVRGGLVELMRHEKVGS